MSSGSSSRRFTDDRSYPNFSVSDVERRRTKIQKLIDRHNFAGKRTVGSTRERLRDVLERQVFRKATDTYNGADTSDVTWAAEESAIAQDLENRRRSIEHILRQFSEEPIIGKNRTDMVNTLAGWYDGIREGLAFNGWGHNYPIWTSIFVKDCSPVERPAGAGKRCVSLTLQALEGPTAGLEWEMVKSHSYALNMLRSTGIPKYEKHRADDLGGMYITAMVAPTKKGVGFDFFHVSSSQATKNKRLYKERLEGCNGAFKPYTGKKCVTCPVGRNACALSRVHKGFRLKRACSVEVGDQHHEGFFRDHSSPICLGCLIKGNDVTRKNE
jgi:hypothetical protein